MRKVVLAGFAFVMATLLWSTVARHAGGAEALASMSRRSPCCAPRLRSAVRYASAVAYAPRVYA